MGFFSRIKNKARGQIAPVMPMAPQPMPRVPVMPEMGDMRFRGRMPQKLSGLSGLFRRLQQKMPVVDTRSFPRIPGPPAVAPDIIPNLDLGMPVMPEERIAPPVMNQMQGQPRMMMSFGGPLMGRAANISRQVLSRNAGKNLPDRMMPGIGDRILGSPGRGQPGGLTYGARDLNRIRNTEDAIIAGGGLGVATLADGTQMFREPFSEENIGIMSPEAFGRDLAQLRMDVGSVVNLAKNKANEIGANINEYVSRARSAYDQEMENQRMQDLDAEQGMQPFSMLMGPDMPLFRPEETDPRVDRMIEAGRGRTQQPQQRQQQESLDDILADLEKKN